MLSATQIAGALAVKRHRIYYALKTPFQLPYIVEDSPRKGGGQTRLYSISNVIPRLRDHFGSLCSITVAKLFEAGGYKR